MKNLLTCCTVKLNICMNSIAYILIIVFIISCSSEDTNSLHLTPEETKYIQSLKKPVIAAPCPDYPPIDFTDHDGNHIGLSHDYLDEISKKLGVTFTVATIQSWADVLQAAKDRKVDIVLSIQDVPERHSYLQFTKPYVRIPNVIVVQKSNTKVNNLDDLAGMKIAAVKGYAVIDFIKKKYPSFTIETVKNETEGLMKLSFGEYDAMIISLSTVSYLVDTYGITNLRIAGTVGYDWNLCIGVRNDDPVLFSIISKALNSIPESKRRAIYQRWISLAPRPFYKEKEFWYILTVLLFGGLLVIIGIIAWNASLRRQVKIKTQQLEDELYWHKKTQEQLLLEKERLLITIQSIGDAFISTDDKGNIILSNKQADVLFNNSISLGKDVKSFVSFTESNKQNLVDPIAECISLKKPIVYYHLKCQCNNRTIDVSVASSPIEIENTIIGAVTIIRDITDMLAMQNELIKLQQFETLGILAAGIAHDFNNILTAIMGNAEIALLMLLKNTKGNDVLEIIDGIKKSVKSAQSLTGQLLTYAKGGKPIKKEGNIIQLIYDTVDFMTHGSSVKVEYIVDDNIENFDFDEHQISHVFRNIVLNAIQAMNKSGVLTVTVKKVELKHDVLQLPDGEYVMIKFSDTGKGIPQEHISKIFDPYFTTKEKGTGLGLTTSLSIIRQHGGTITVSSSDKGTEFTVYLPKIKGTVSVNETHNARVDSISAHVLILDDRQEILDVTAGMLDILGCTYDTANHSDDAINKILTAKERGKPFDCVLVDITIPGSISGVDAFAQMKKIQEKLKGIVMSGYADNSAIADYAQYGFSWYLVKPFTFDDLKQALIKATIA
ncbi:MAG: transporter substrate-binding domain-containing protein [Spirochaetota bacterium]|nr:transporter substrate-binding domain-containing protein [Spirochaetota bacterium]